MSVTSIIDNLRNQIDSELQSLDKDDRVAVLDELSEWCGNRSNEESEEEEDEEEEDDEE